MLTPYNSAIDDTTSYIPRFHTLHLSLSPSPSGALPFTLTPFVTDTTLLLEHHAPRLRQRAGLGSAAGRRL